MTAPFKALLITTFHMYCSLLKHENRLQTGKENTLPA
uniref:Uncharacterized protein n=1 Tax=Arundo donax TaxID=35708 RepID=A0A0A8ZF21_ARUDO